MVLCLAGPQHIHRWNPYYESLNEWERNTYFDVARRTVTVWERQFNREGCTLVLARDSRDELVSEQQIDVGFPGRDSVQTAVYAYNRVSISVSSAVASIVSHTETCH